MPAAEERYLRERRPPDWRSDVLTASGLNALAGVWLIIAPWALGYRGGDPYWNDVLFGGVVALFGFVKVAGAMREAGLSYLNALIGVWLFIAAFVIDSTSQAFWNDIILGIIVFVLAIVSATASERGMRRSGRRI